MQRTLLWLIALAAMAVLALAVGCDSGQSTDQPSDTTAAIGTDSQKAAPSGSAAKVVFAELEHDFGDVPRDQKAEYSFKLKNEGTENLKILSAKGS